MNGSSRVPIDYVIDGFALGKWISHRRDAYKKGRLDQSVIEQFEASSADWSWTPFNDTWEAAFILLCDYVAVYGNSRIPNSFVFKLITPKFHSNKFFILFWSTIYFIKFSLLKSKDEPSSFFAII